MNIVLIGMAGSGKGTQAKKIAEKYGLKHISTGDVLRAEVATGSDLGKKIKDFQDKGELVPTSIVVEALKKYLADNNIFDGFPRNLEQAKALDEFVKVDLVIYLKIPDEVAVDRLSKRRQCESCGFITDSSHDKCPVCGGRLFQRSDDTPEAIKKRLALFHDVTEPLLEYYKPRDIVHIVDGVRSVDEIFQEICAIIDESFV